MGTVGLLAVGICAAACGRVGFEPFGPLGAGGDATRDGLGGDGLGGDGAAVSSCVGLADTCGPAGTSPCCGSPLVTGGTFLRGDDVGGDGLNSDLTHPATVSDFRLDTYEVTVGRFRQFVNAGGGTQASPPAPASGARALNGMANQGGWDPAWNGSLTATTTAFVAALKCNAMYQTWTDAPGANESVPIQCVTWFEAMAFCVWDGGYLPTEAQWHYAAAGGSEQRAFPWSSPASSLVVDCSYTNYFAGSFDCTNPPNGLVNRVGSESPNGDGRWGQADLAGNSLEWTLDWYLNPYVNPCDDCAYLTDSGYRVIGSTSFDNDAQYVRGATRLEDLPASRTAPNGVRCARAP